MVPRQEEGIEATERVRLLQEAIRGLPPKGRAAFLLHKFMAVPHSEIAVRLGMTKDMVEGHIINALAHCRKMVEGIG